LKADLEENKPFEEGVQMKEGKDERSILIFRISLTLEGSKMVVRRGKFQEELEGIKSWMVKRE
jgi:hypothetical protein